MTGRLVPAQEATVKDSLTAQLAPAPSDWCLWDFVALAVVLAGHVAILMTLASGGGCP